MHVLIQSVRHGDKYWELISPTISSLFSAMHSLLDVLVALERVEDNGEVLVAVLQPVQCCPVHRPYLRGYHALHRLSRLMLVHLFV